MLAILELVFFGKWFFSGKGGESARKMEASVEGPET